MATKKTTKKEQDPVDAAGTAEATTEANAEAVDDQPENPGAEPAGDSGTVEAATAAGDNHATDESNAAPSRRREPRAPVSQAVVRMALHLRSRHAQRVYRRSYTTASRALYTLSVMLRIYANEQEAEQVGAMVDQMLSTVREDLAGEIARMEKVAETQGVDLSAIEYTQPQEFTAEVSTPKAGQYLGLIREMDRFIGLMDLLWLSGVYTDAQYNAGSYQWQRRLVKLANRLRNLAQRAMALSRREGSDSGNLTDMLFGDDNDGDDNDDDDAPAVASEKTAEASA